MKNKGFTLTELLGAIVILSLLSLIAIPAVTNSVKKGKNDLYDTQINNILASAKIWGADHLYDLPEAGSCKYLTLKDLKEEGLIDSSITNPKTNEEFSDDLKIKITTTLTSKNVEVSEYEVDPENIDGCTYVYESTDEI